MLRPYVDVEVRTHEEDPGEGEGGSSELHIDLRILMSNCDDQSIGVVEKIVGRDGKTET